MKGFVVWLTGVSGSGKSTVARGLEALVRERGLRCEVIDGDVIRTQLSKGLGFSKADRDENVRRIAFACELLVKHEVAVIVAAVSPYREARDDVRARIARFVEVHMTCPLEVLRARDPKGLYRKALAGELPHFTGVSAPYEEPLAPEVTIDSSIESAEESVGRAWRKLTEMGLV